MPVHIPDYPRPQFVREGWENLNGPWKFAFDDENRGEAEHWYRALPAQREIEVPFTYETPASGIGEAAFHPVVWYGRTVTLAPEAGREVLLHFEGSDYHTRLWVNGQLAGEHRGGYTRFTFDITALAQPGENTLVVRVEDSDDTQQPRGKQRWLKENFGCWYVQTTGIWKTVWLETAAPARLERVKMTPNLASASLWVEWKVKTGGASGLSLKVDISFEGQDMGGIVVPVPAERGRFNLSVGSKELSPWGLRVWSPESPELYDIRFQLLHGGALVDTVDSYFGMREVSINNGQVLLNGKPCYQRLLLDQGYWPDSHLTPPSEAALIEDIDKTAAMGFNGMRKHQKVEDERFYYWCDVKGLLVWSEMPSAYTFGDDMVANFLDEWRQVVQMHYNHPCVITWTPINESWGVPEIAEDRMQQSFSQAVYHLTKAMDNTRPVIVNDGWEHTVSDIITLHDYEEKGEVFFERYASQKDGILGGTVRHNRGKLAFAEGFAYRGQPVLISEYGGAAFSGKAGGAWGYGNGVPDAQALAARIESMTDAIMRLPYVCGYCYTQTTDVQQEVNGLLDEQRQPKADMAVLREIFGREP